MIRDDVPRLPYQQIKMVRILYNQYVPFCPVLRKVTPGAYIIRCQMYLRDDAGCSLVFLGESVVTMDGFMYAASFIRACLHIFLSLTVNKSEKETLTHRSL
ncbi:hypothetical protein AVEN_123462-1 [Araneus ventricosus]|uniref:Uncharacterized protein n=1 Tax=Araneus ventricosus TaxID=182803 RepID=A0A4Y2MCX2_ARAVE|nr:hypothetical protein AVEN_123462-1 [Araneus ventricosus]